MLNSPATSANLQRAPGTSGTLTWSLIPLSAAATGNTSVSYVVGGMLSYVQDGVTHDIQLTPDTIEVLPSPYLQIRYFWQTDIICR